MVYPGHHQDCLQPFGGCVLSGPGACPPLTRDEVELHFEREANKENESPVSVEADEIYEVPCISTPDDWAFPFSWPRDGYHRSVSEGDVHRCRPFCIPGLGTGSWLSSRSLCETDFECISRDAIQLAERCRSFLDRKGVDCHNFHIQHDRAMELQEKLISASVVLRTLSRQIGIKYYLDYV